MNRFYNIPKILLWPLVCILMFLGGMPLGLSLTFAILNSPLFLFFTPFAIPLAIFSITPLLKQIGLYHYYSPMLLAIINKKKIDLHNGTSFDYLFVMKFSDYGYKAQKKLLKYFLEGLLKLIVDIESGKIPKDIIIEGTSYFFSINTVNKFGFTLLEPKFSHRLNFIFNFLDLFWMYSYSKGKISLPKIFDIKRAMTNGENLCNQKSKIETLLSKIKN